MLKDYYHCRFFCCIAPACLVTRSFLPTRHGRIMHSAPAVRLIAEVSRQARSSKQSVLRIRSARIIVRRENCSGDTFFQICYKEGQSKIYIIAQFEVQWNPVNTDTKGTCRNVRIIGVSVLSGLPDKSHGHMFYRWKDQGRHFYVNKTFFSRNKALPTGWL